MSTKQRQNRLAEKWQNVSFQERRELIIDTAMKLLQQRGLKAVTTRRVASMLGVGTMTLYTYLNGQNELYREMVTRGFAMLRSYCTQCHVIDPMSPPRGKWQDWLPGAHSYVQFATDHPNLYKLMFDTPVPRDARDVLESEFRPLLDIVRAHLIQKFGETEDMEDRARRAAVRYWIGLHGLASLAIVERFNSADGSLDDILADLLQHIAPTS